MTELLQFGALPIDNAILNHMLSDYRYPEDKISTLVSEGTLIRLKRGVYVVSPTLSGELLSTELIANHLYGPSYVSMESALHYYGLIPESVYNVRSMTTKRSRQFNNSIGLFQYVTCSREYYPIGIKQSEENGYFYLIASPEKALCDLIAYTPNLNLRSQKNMLLFLEEDLRIDMDRFYDMDIEIFRWCADVGKKKNDIKNIIKLLSR